MAPWSRVIRHYEIYHRPRSQAEILWFRRQVSLAEAVRTAARAENEGRKRYSHQQRIKAVAIEEAEDRLLGALSALEKCSSFHELWQTIAGLVDSVDGIGELYVYDTALRIGAFKGVLPDRVYLHRGTRAGARAFGIKPAQPEWVTRDELPSALRGCPPHEVEDILCIYKGKELSTNHCENSVGSRC